MFGLFSRSKSLIDSSLLKGAVDNHSHILPGLDDGVKEREDSLQILAFLAEQGFSEVWFTPHVMEDVPNTTEGLRAAFDTFCAGYDGPLRLHLAAEYMLDNLFRERLKNKDFLLHGEDRVLVETSVVAPPLDLEEMLSELMSAGFRPLLAHPERYAYMRPGDYARFHEKGILFQLNLPSLVGTYGPEAAARAEDLLKRGWYCMAGSDCHRQRRIRQQYSAPVLKKKTLAALAPIMQGL